MINSIVKFTEKYSLPLPLCISNVSAGFPSPAEDYAAGQLDLNELLIKRPSATFFVRVSGESMKNAGIHHQDLLVVDRSIEPSNGKIVIAAVDGQLTLKRLRITQAGKIYLLPENEEFPPIEVKPENEIYIWGVVTNVIHSV